MPDCASIRKPSRHSCILVMVMLLLTNPTSVLSTGESYRSRRRIMSDVTIDVKSPTAATRANTIRMSDHTTTTGQASTRRRAELLCMVISPKCSCRLQSTNPSTTPSTAPLSEITQPSIMKMLRICLFVAPRLRNMPIESCFSIISSDSAPITLKVAITKINARSRNDTHFSMFIMRNASSSSINRLRTTNFAPSASDMALITACSLASGASRTSMLVA